MRSVSRRSTFQCIILTSTQDLRALAKQEKKKFAGSTSSLTGYLSQIYFLLSEFKELDYSTLSQHFKSAVCLLHP